MYGTGIYSTIANLVHARQLSPHNHSVRLDYIQAPVRVSTLNATVGIPPIFLQEIIF
jgi:hypothetical protein